MTDERKPRDRDERLTTAPPPGSPAERALSPEPGPITARTKITKDNLEAQATAARVKIRAKTNPQLVAFDPDKIGAHASLASTQAELLRVEVNEDMRIMRGEVHELAGDVANVRQTVGRLEGGFEAVKSSVDTLVRVVEQREQVKTVTLTAQVDVEKQQATAAIEVGKARALDAVERGQWLRKLAGETWVKVIGAVTGAGGMAAIGALLARGC